MPKLWCYIHNSATPGGGCSKRFFISEQEARLIMAGAAGGGAAKLEAVELDELELRQAAANWLNMQAKCRENALKREANKTAKQRSDNMKKAWITRRKKTE